MIVPLLCPTQRQFCFFTCFFWSRPLIMLVWNLGPLLRAASAGNSVARHSRINS